MCYPEAIIITGGMDQDSDSQLRQALAIAIVKERKQLTNASSVWKERALKAEAELRQLKASLEGLPSDDAFLEKLSQLNELVAAERPSAAVDDVLRRQATLSTFLKNAHALRTAQVNGELRRSRCCRCCAAGEATFPL